MALTRTSRAAGWIDGWTDEHYWMAKVYDEGRVSKLTVYDGRTSKSPEIYSYDRGLDFDHAPACLIDQILEQIG